MGFMGLGAVVEVDGASDLKYSLLGKIQERFSEELKDPGNAYNPPGFVNILLVLSEEPNLARYLNKKIAYEIDRQIREFPADSWNRASTNAEYGQLVRNFRKIKAIKKALK